MLGEKDEERPKETTQTLLIHGLKIVPSQQAQDLLAAFHLGAQTVLAALSPNNVNFAGQPQPPVSVQMNQEEISNDISLQDLDYMDPLRREAILSAYGLTTKAPPEGEPDITAATFNQMLEEDGIPTKPGPGGAIARTKPDEDEALANYTLVDDDDEEED